MGQENRKFTLVFFGLIYLAVTYFFIMNVLKGGAFNLFFAAMSMMPFIAIVLNHYRTYWFGLFFGLCMFNTLRIPVPILSGFTLYGMMIFVFWFFLVLDYAIRRERRVFMIDRLEYKLFILLAILVVARLISDPPGSARMGESGGLSTALPFFQGAIVFPLGYWLVKQMGDWHRNMRIAVILMGVAFFYVVVFGAAERAQEGYQWFYALSFNRQLYLPIAIVLADGIRQVVTNQKSFSRFAGWVVWGMVLSILSAVRSAPFQMAAMAGTAGWLYHRLRGVVVLLGVVGFFGVSGLLMVVPFSQLPGSIQRTVSVLIPGQARSSHIGELGWESSFRADLRKVAYKEIRKHPFIGSGWGFSRTEIIQAVSIQEFRDARTAKLAISGSYHCTPLIIAAKNGVAVAIIFLVAVGVCGIRLLKWTVSRPPDDEAKYQVAVLLVYASTIFLMMWVNGHGYELTMLLLSLGAASAIVDRAIKLESNASADKTEKSSGVI